FDLSEGRYTMYWNNVNSKDEICFAINVQTTGWVGFGFSPNGDMSQSDFLMGWVKDGVTTFDDRWAEVRGAEPTIDAVQDYTLISGEEVNGNTSFEFCRIFLTCDEFDREILTGTTR
ncbi:DOMON domain-containing protein, partial [Salmonella sp. s54836]|uniref:DOMON domain-containing protein n=1 Tax=Salmonella sp. s54836 TaxID=3159673 RepID=UPI0039816F53